MESPESTTATTDPKTPQTVTAVSDFKKRADERTNGKLLELPTGSVVRVTRPSINKLISVGHVPSDVASVLLSGKAEKASTNPKEFEKLVKLQKIVAEYAVLEPKVVPGEANYDAGEVSVEDFEDEELAAIMMYVQQGVTDFAKFRSDG